MVENLEGNINSLLEKLENIYEIKFTENQVQMSKKHEINGKLYKSNWDIFIPIRISLSNAQLEKGQRFIPFKMPFTGTLSYTSDKN